jgi:hypothetical protein
MQLNYLKIVLIIISITKINFMNKFENKLKYLVIKRLYKIFIQLK